MRTTGASIDLKSVYEGELVYRRQVPSALRLITTAREIAEREFHPLLPTTAQREMEPADFRRAVLSARKAFMGSTGNLVAELLCELGCEPGETYRDRAILRFQPSGDSHTSRRIQNLPWHRDSWGSNIMCQVNWWMPVYPLVSGASMEMRPDLFSTPVVNDSENWEKDRALAGASPLLPSAVAGIPDGTAVEIMMEPGDIVCFSAAHLHASQINTTGQTRVSIDLRTVNGVDLEEGRGAVQVDGNSRQTARDWFFRVSDGEPLDRRQC